MIDSVMAGLKWLVLAGVVVWAGAHLLDRIGPTEPLRLTLSPEADGVGADLDAWLADREARFADLRPEAAKEIVWAGVPGARTPLAVAYLHGYSASKAETRPLADEVARQLGANLYFARLSGHGRGGAAMAEPTVGDWIDDTAETMEIARRLGERVILMGSSTGGTLATLAAASPDMKRGLAGLVLLSPNYRAAGWGGRLVEWPHFRIWAPAVLGAERAWEAVNAEHGANWTPRYPLISVAPLGALTRHVRAMNVEAVDVPALFFVSPGDRVIDPLAAEFVAARWGASATLVPVRLGPGDDPASHVLAGDILSPSQTAGLAARIVAWVSAL